MELILKLDNQIEFTHDGIKYLALPEDDFFYLPPDIENVLIEKNIPYDKINHVFTPVNVPDMEL